MHYIQGSHALYYTNESITVFNRICWMKRKEGKPETFALLIGKLLFVRHLPLPTRTHSSFSTIVSLQN